ncbi:hypothetical protein NECAME_19679, partial [Necator americanus]
MQLGILWLGDNDGNTHMVVTSNSVVMRHLILLSLVSLVLGQDLTCRTTQFQYCQAMLSSGVGLNDTMSGQMFKDYTVLYNWFLYKWGLTPGSTTNMLN